MPVPDEVVFGPGPGGHYNYGQMRELNESERIAALRSRLETFLLNQVDKFAVDEHGKWIYPSPFPLAVMTCVGIESLGQVMYRARNKDSEGGQRDCFVAVASKLHPHFSRQFKKEFKIALRKRWPGKDTEQIGNAAELMYTFFRNTMIHGYWGRAVYLTHTDTDDWEEGDGYLTLNPWWFWDAFKKRFHALFDEALGAEANNPLYLNCVDYVDRLLK